VLLFLQVDTSPASTSGSVLAVYDGLCMHFLRRVSEALDRASNWVDRHSIITCSSIIAAYFGITCVAATNREFWYDELVTWSVARLPDIKAIWAALHHGVDQTLPLVHLLVRLSQSCFGYGELATRLPSIIFFAVFCISFFIFLKRRVETSFAIAGMLIPLISYAWFYSYEARSYAILLGGVGVALACWQAAAENIHRRWTLPGITVGLLFALLTNFMSVLVAIPFGSAEAVRNIVRRRVDFGVWIAFTCAASALVIYPGLLKSTETWTRNSPPAFSIIPSFISVLTEQAACALLAATALVFIDGFMRQAPPRQVNLSAMPVHEVTALIGFIVAPILFIVGSRFTLRLFFFPRYGLIAIIGAAGLLVLVLRRFAGGDRRTGAVFASALFCWFLAYGGLTALNPASGQPAKPEPPTIEDSSIKEALRSGLPVVSSSPLYILPADHYLPRTDAQRLYYLLDSSGQDYGFGHGLLNHLAVAFAQTFRTSVHMIDIDRFISANGHFVLCAGQTGADESWLMDRLRTAGYTLTLRSYLSGRRLYDVVRSRPCGYDNGSAAASQP